MTRRHPHKSPFIVAASIICMVAVTYFGFLLLDRRTAVLDIESVIIAPNPAKPGDTISISWSAVARRSCDGVVIRQIIDSRGRVFDYARIDTAYHDLLPPVTARTFTRHLTLPSDIAPGVAEYRSLVYRWCNQVQRLFWPMTDNGSRVKFTIADPDRP